MGNGNPCGEQQAFDADAWGASPHWDPEAERSVYDDDLDHEELVPLARSVVAVTD